MTASATSIRKLPSREERFRAIGQALARRCLSQIQRERQISQGLQRGTLVYKPRIEMCDDPSSSRIVVTLELPGMKSEEVGVRLLEDNVLLVSGERRRRTPSGQEGNLTYPVRELKYGNFERLLRVPDGTMMSTTSAAMNDGLLVISWPRVPPGATPAPTRDSSS